MENSKPVPAVLRLKKTPLYNLRRVCKIAERKLKKSKEQYTRNTHLWNLAEPLKGTYINKGIQLRIEATEAEIIFAII